MSSLGTRAMPPQPSAIKPGEPQGIAGWAEDTLKRLLAHNNRLSVIAERIRGACPTDALSKENPTSVMSTFAEINFELSRLAAQIDELESLVMG